VTLGGKELGTAVIVEDPLAVERRPPGDAAAAVYDRPISLGLLYEDAASGDEHYVVEYPPDLKGHVHRHTAAHTIVVLKGKLDANGQVIGRGSYAHFPAGELMRHQAADEGGCVFLLMFHGRFDVQLVD
jgi:hypothetical protein